MIVCTLFLGLCILAAGSYPAFVNTVGPVGSVSISLFVFPVIIVLAVIVLIVLVGEWLKH